MKVKGSHDNLTEDMMVEVVKRQHSVRNAFRKDSCTVKNFQTYYKRTLTSDTAFQLFININKFDITVDAHSL